MGKFLELSAEGWVLSNEGTAIELLTSSLFQKGWDVQAFFTLLGLHHGLFTTVAIIQAFCSNSSSCSKRADVTAIADSLAKSCTNQPLRVLLLCGKICFPSGLMDYREL